MGRLRGWRRRPAVPRAWPTATSASSASRWRSSSPSRAYIAEDACDLIELDIEEIPAIVGHDAALAVGCPPGPPGARATTSTGRSRRHRIPSWTRSSSRPPTSSPRRSTSTATCACRWSPAASCRSWDGFRNELVVHTSTQGAHGVRGFLSRALDLPENRVRVVMGDVGGGFGQKMFMIPEEVAVVLAGKRLGRPVKWIEDRRENLMSGQHARNDRMTLSIALDDDGHILGMRGDLVEDVGAFPAAGSSSIGFVGLLFPGRTRSRAPASPAPAVYTNTCGRCAYRGPWMMETTAREQMMDIIARQLGIDPLELRRRNVVAGRRPAVHHRGRAGLRPGVDRRLAGAGRRADRLRRVPRRAGAGPRRGPAARHRARPVRRAVGHRHGQHGQRGRDRQHRRQRPGAGADEHRQPRPEPGDHDGPGRGRPPRRRRRRRHRHPGRHRVRTVRPGHRRQPQRGDPQRRGQLRPPGGCATRCWRSPPTTSRRRPRTSRSSAAGSPWSARRPRRRRSPRSPASPTSTPPALPPGMELGLEEKARYTPTAPFTFSNSCHACVCEVDPRTGAVTHPALRRQRGLRRDDQPQRRRGPDRRRRGAGHRRRALRAHGLRRRRQPADHDVRGLPAAHRGRGAGRSSTATSRPRPSPTPAATRGWARAARSARRRRWSTPSPTRWPTSAPASPASR